jgi:copper resistance protein B
MMNKLLRFMLIGLCGWLAAVPAFAGGTDNPLLLMIDFKEFEWRDTFDGDALVWRGELWLGKDRDKALLKTRAFATENDTEAFELQMLYSRAISPYWDLQLGWRGNFQPEKLRNWAAIGVQGLAPGFIETELGAFVGDSGRLGLRARGGYEMLLTNRLVLEPELEFNWFSKEDPENGIGSGLSNFEAGLRLRYLVTRQFAPYIGVVWEKLLGDSRDFAEAEAGDSSDLQATVGVRFWF